MVSNDSLAELIIKIDPGAERWAFNRHCGYCGRYMYQDESNCKKCHSKTRPMLRPIPFMTSATAIEKLLMWLRETNRIDTLNCVLGIIMKWAKSGQDAETYKLQIVIEVDQALGCEAK